MSVLVLPLSTNLIVDQSSTIVVDQSTKYHVRNFVSYSQLYSIPILQFTMPLSSRVQCVFAGLLDPSKTVLLKRTEQINAQNVNVNVKSDDKVIWIDYSTARSKLAFRKTSASRCWGDRLARLRLHMLPAKENALSEGADVAGTAKYFLARSFST